VQEKNFPEKTRLDSLLRYGEEALGEKPKYRDNVIFRIHEKPNYLTSEYILHTSISGLASWRILYIHT
jgi:hypothetical protein